MEFDAKSLAAALRGEEAARANLAAMQDEQKQAQAMATRQNTGKTIFSALGNNAVRSRGMSQVKEIQPRLAKARQQAASTYGAKDLHNAARVAEQTEYSRGRDTASDQQSAAALALTAENRAIQEAQDAAALQLTAENRVTQEAQDAAALQLTAENRASEQAAAQAKLDRELAAEKAKIALEQERYDAKEVVRENALTASVAAAGETKRLEAEEVEREVAQQEFENAQQLIENDLATRIQDPTERAGAQKESFEHFSSRAAVDSIAKTAAEFTPEEVATLQGFRQRFGRQLAQAVIPNDFQQMIEGEYKTYTPRVKKFLNQVRSENAAIRHALFGAALTPTEKASGETHLLGATGLALDDIMLRLGEVDGKAVRGLQSLDNAYSPGRPYATRGDYTALSGYDTMRGAQVEAGAAAEAAIAEGFAPPGPKALEAFKNPPEGVSREEFNAMFKSKYGYVPYTRAN
jgi:hypothetical protein